MPHNAMAHNKQVNLGNDTIFGSSPLDILQDTCACYSLRGIIYFKNNHFTECLITNSGMVQFHDGMFTGRSLLYETNNLTLIRSNHATMTFYSHDPIQNLLH